MVNEARYLAWNCKLKMRLSNIVLHLRNNYRQILTQQLQKTFSTISFYNVFKTIVTFWRVKNKKKAFSFLSEPEVLPCFELNYKFLEGHEKPLSLATTRKQENPVNTAQKMARQSSTKQNGEGTMEEVPGSIVTYTEEEINTINPLLSPLSNIAPPPFSEEES